MKIFGIMGAMKEEINYFVAHSKILKKEKYAGITFYVGKLSGKDVVIALSGIGKVNSAVATQLMIERYNIDALIFTGLAGSLDNKHSIGDIVLATSLIQHDFDLTAFGRKLGEIPKLGVEFKSTELLNSAIEKSFKRAFTTSPKLFKGIIVSGDTFIAEKKRAMKLKELFQASATEMEGASVAQVCVMNKLPFVILRTISDSADEDANVDFKTILDRASENGFKIIKDFLENYES